MKPILARADLFRCPLCQVALTAGETSLRCEKGHDFAISKKGYADFCPSARAGAYDDALFDSRSRFIAGGFYGKLIEALCAMLDKYAPEGPILDAGCGEGSFLKALVPEPATRPCIGLDLSRPGIQRAARGGGGWLWAVGDLSRLPLQTSSMAQLPGVQPSASARRRCAEGGARRTVFMRGPGPGEGSAAPRSIQQRAGGETVHGQLRDAGLLGALPHPAPLDNFEMLGSLELCRTRPLSPAQAADLVAMTPMTQGIQKEQLNTAALDSVTIHLHILAGRPR